MENTSMMNSKLGIFETLSSEIWGIHIVLSPKPTATTPPPPPHVTIWEPRQGSRYVGI
jgi:hypothetical protein